jgi:SulP family sulfate permease
MSIYFGSINHILKRINQIADIERVDHILIISSGINFIDYAGAESLVAENERLKKIGGGLYFVGLKSSVYEFAARSGFIKHLGNDHFFDSKRQAIEAIYRRLDKVKCDNCSAKIFRECP